LARLAELSSRRRSAACRVRRDSHRKGSHAAAWPREHIAPNAIGATSVGHHHLRAHFGHFSVLPFYPPPPRGYRMPLRVWEGKRQDASRANMLAKKVTGECHFGD